MFCREKPLQRCGPDPQVILAEDTLRPGEPLVAIKILKRQHGYAGLKVCLGADPFHAVVTP